MSKDARSVLLDDHPDWVRQNVSGVANVKFAFFRRKHFDDDFLVPDDEGYTAIFPGSDVLVLDESDQSDPLNEFVVICFRVGKEFAARVTFSRCPDMTAQQTLRQVLPFAIGCFIRMAVDHAAEIRDAVSVVGREEK